MAHIGIDLGTSNIMVAHLSGRGEPEILYIDNEKMIPSCIYVEEPGGNITVGKVALDMWATGSPANGFRGWKPFIGEGKVLGTVQIGDAPVLITPEYLTARMVEYIVGKIARGLGGHGIESVLVTVPHGWRRENPEKCRATRLAAARARLGDKNITVQPLTVSEPVAAAAYYVWDAHRKGIFDALRDQTLLVCDIGGGTVDLSLVRVGAEAKLLDVVDAENINVAGDYVDVALCAWVCQQFNEKFGTDYPTSVPDLLARLEDPREEHLRSWLLKARNMKHTLSDRASALVKQKRGGTLQPVKEDFADSNHHLKVILGAAEFVACAEPFYAASRELIQKFLSRHKDSRLYAVLLAGGGSRMMGVREHILEPSLRQFYPEGEVAEILERVPVNWERSDEVIALGAALIANDVVSIREYLLNDVGLIATIPDFLAQKVGLEAREQKVLITPILKKGEPLPAVASSAQLGLQTAISPGESLDLEVVVDDGSSMPWVQRQTFSHPAGGRMQSVEWEMSADVDGGLTFRLRPAAGRPIEMVGRITYTGRAKLIVAPEPGGIPRITPEKLRKAIEQLKRQA